MEATRYVLGFMFNPLMNGVVLIRKDAKVASLQWMHGLLNGVGGKINADEAPLDAMVREFREEAGVDTEATRWRYYMNMIGVGWTCAVFAYHANEGEFQQCQTQGSEAIVKASPLNVQRNVGVSNLPWLIWMAIDVLQNHNTSNNRLVGSMVYNALQSAMPDGVYRSEFDAAIKQPFAPVPDDLTTPDPQTINLNMMEVLNQPTETLGVKTAFAGEQVEGMVGRIDFTQNGVADLLRWMEAHPDDQPVIMMNDNRLYIAGMEEASNSEQPYRPVQYNMLRIGWSETPEYLPCFNDMDGVDLMMMAQYINQIDEDPRFYLGGQPCTTTEAVQWAKRLAENITDTEAVNIWHSVDHPHGANMSNDTRALNGRDMIKAGISSREVYDYLLQKGYKASILVTTFDPSAITIKLDDSKAVGPTGVVSGEIIMGSHHYEPGYDGAGNLVEVSLVAGPYNHLEGPTDGPSFDDSEKQDRGGQIEHLVAGNLQPESSAGSEPFPGNIPGQTVEGSETGSTPVSLDDSAGLPADSDAITERTSTGKRKTRRGK